MNCEARFAGETVRRSYHLRSWVSGRPRLGSAGTQALPARSPETRAEKQQDQKRLIQNRGFFFPSALRPVWPGRCIGLSFSLCTTSRLAPWTRGDSNVGPEGHLATPLHHSAGYPKSNGQALASAFPPQGESTYNYTSNESPKLRVAQQPAEFGKILPGEKALTATAIGRDRV